MSPAAPPALSGAATDCFHCGLPVPRGASFGFDAPGGWRAFCCAGCEAVSRAITGRGLDDYERLVVEAQLIEIVARCVLAVLIGAAFWLAMDGGQFDDLERPGLDVVLDDDRPSAAIDPRPQARPSGQQTALSEYS